MLIKPFKLQGNWNQHQHQHQQPNHYRQQHAGAQPGLQQYALVPINGPGMNSPGMINGPPGPIVSMGPQGFNIGPGIMPAQMTGPSHAPGGLPNFRCVSCHRCTPTIACMSLRTSRTQSAQQSEGYTKTTAAANISAVMVHCACLP